MATKTIRRCGEQTEREMRRLVFNRGVRAAAKIVEHAGFMLTRAQVLALLKPVPKKRR